MLKLILNVWTLFFLPGFKYTPETIILTLAHPSFPRQYKTGYLGGFAPSRLVISQQQMFQGKEKKKVLEGSCSWKYSKFHPFFPPYLRDSRVIQGKSKTAFQIPLLPTGAPHYVRYFCVCGCKTVVEFKLGSLRVAPNKQVVVPFLKLYKAGPTSQRWQL